MPAKILSLAATIGHGRAIYFGDPMSNLRTPLARVRGLGSAKDGVAHWWAQRVSALALIPLLIWFVLSLLAVANDDHAEVISWIGQPWNSALLVLLLIVGSSAAWMTLKRDNGYNVEHHSYSGLQYMRDAMVIEHIGENDAGELVAQVRTAGQGHSTVAFAEPTQLSERLTASVGPADVSLHRVVLADQPEPLLHSFSASLMTRRRRR